MIEAKECGVPDTHGFVVGFWGETSIRLTRGDVDAIFDDALGAKYFLMGYDQAVRDGSKGNVIGSLAIEVDTSEVDGAIARMHELVDLARVARAMGVMK